MVLDTLPEVLTTEAKELNEYVRMYFQTYVAWFTFFITVLFTSMAWALKTSFDEKLRLRWAMPVYLVYGLFATQIVFGVIGTWYVRNDIAAASNRVTIIQNAIAANGPLRPQSPVPQSFTFTLGLMGCTLLVNLLFWGYIVMKVKGLGKRDGKQT